MPKVTNGAELVRQLRESGTGEPKLVIARKVLADTLEHDGRVATADEVVAALEAALPEGHLTVAKAKAIAETGEWKGPAADAGVPLEEQLLAAAAKEAEKKPAGDGDKKPDPKK